jgi:nucleoside 2-deoxyribosyltransferase
MKIYVASSWKNTYYPTVVDGLKQAGHTVFDFRENGFNWAEVDPGFAARMDCHRFLDMLHHGEKQNIAFGRDMGALESSDAVVLVAPCGKSAHLELGWACGHGKVTAALLEPRTEPELMYKMVDCLTSSMQELLAFLGSKEKR